MKKNRLEGIACDCRSAKTTLKDFKSFFTAKEGTVILRLKSKIDHKNSAMRDPALLRIIDHSHPRTKNKYRVWPTYDFENSVMDGVLKITHRLRSKEFELRNELQRFIQNLCNLPQTKIFEFGRFNLSGVESSGRVIRKLIESKKLSGWDDPRLTTLVALRRRGFLPQAIASFTLSTGMTKSEATLTWDDFIVHNRRLLDDRAKRFFFIKNPKKITIANAPEMTITLRCHPNNDFGTRTFQVGKEFYVCDDDYDLFNEEELTRLMDCENFEKKGDSFVFHSKDVYNFKLAGKKRIIHWLPVNASLLKTKIIMPDMTSINGFSETGVAQLKIGEHIQFERFGFVRLDSVKNDLYTFYYTHN